MSHVTKISVVTTVLASSLFLGGCGLFGAKEKANIDPPEGVTLVDDESGLKEVNGEEAAKTDSKEKATKTIKTELYLIDKSGFVVPQTLELPSNTAVAQQALEYLVANGPVSEMLPNGFRAVIPADTHVSVDIKEGVATADFSKEFATYQKEDELKILQAITYTLTQFDTVDKVVLKMNGTKLNEMPVNKTPISDGLNRSVGINFDLSDVMDVSNTMPLTVYYVGGDEGSYYYVPVTKRVKDTKTDTITAAVNELVKGPGLASSLLSGFMDDVALIEEPKNEDGKVTLNFNENILGSFKEKKISKDVLDTLVLSLTEQKDIESVEVLVQGKGGLLDDAGKALSEPVSRPAKVNTGSY
ncbi:GerMN domain-containing protein [Peribacillus huizhouensis]|uniref:Germination protein M n=1 Tax=Peribacillus huizhouensis TaxID=1501239 RepID=A0ABR6CL84_9BACI|nr:GerMN domain-containing protein [Peribacillus huizhouensis]MBA9025790.1 germination protein M [Peribacillus huizhouensis]